MIITVNIIACLQIFYSPVVVHMVMFSVSEMWKLFALLTVFTLATVLVVNADNSQVDDAVNKVKETAEKATTIEVRMSRCLMK